MLKGAIITAKDLRSEDQVVYRDGVLEITSVNCRRDFLEVVGRYYTAYGQNDSFGVTAEPDEKIILLFRKRVQL